MSEAGSSKLYALLIGIDRYCRGGKPARGLYGDFEGAVRDIRGMADFLLEERHVCENRIRRLSASTSFQENADDTPTYDNITRALQDLRRRAQRGDRVLIHYSGHGGRVPALCPEVKRSRLDEVLVPADIADPEARYLRDIELAFYLRRMLDQGLLVTFVLDCCHAGGALRMRSGPPRSRGIRGASGVDRKAPRLASGVASREELIAAWKALASSPPKDRGAQVYRHARALSGWLPNPRDYVLLAACRHNQKAFEHRFEPAGKNGALTWWLLKFARQLGPRATCQEINDRIVDKVRRHQSPQLEGAASRVFLGTEEREQVNGVGVLEIDAGGDLLLAAGQAHGFHEGTSFDVYPGGRTASRSAPPRLAVVRIFELGDRESWAEVVERSGDRDVEPGDRSVVDEHGTGAFSHGVRLLATDGAEDLRRALGTAGKGLLHLASGRSPADFEVQASHNGFEVRYEKRPAPELGAAPREGNAAVRLVRKLRHVARYRNLRNLTNPEPRSLLADGVRLQLCRLPPDFDRARAARAKPSDLARSEDLGDGAAVEVEQLLCLVLENSSGRDLHVAVFDFAVDWSLRQFHPNPKRSAAAVLDRGERKILPFRAYLPENYQEGIDVLKVFATVDTTDFRPHQLSSIYDLKKKTTRRSRGRARTSLERLLLAAAGELPSRPLRRPTYRGVTGQEWTTAQMSIRVVRTSEVDHVRLYAPPAGRPERSS